jgi:hypothetical protein
LTGLLSALFARLRLRLLAGLPLPALGRFAGLFAGLPTTRLGRLLIGWLPGSVGLLLTALWIRLLTRFATRRLFL